jgi:hypothetical protein
MLAHLAIGALEPKLRPVLDLKFTDLGVSNCDIFQGRDTCYSLRVICETLKECLESISTVGTQEEKKQNS